MKKQQQLEGWDDLEEALIYDRYSIREPKTGKRLERTFDDVGNRIATYLTDAKRNFPISKDLVAASLAFLLQRKVMLATPALMNLGNPFSRRLGYYSCYPLGPIPDTTSEILKYLCSCASIFQFAGGSGLDFSLLRGRDAPVDNFQGLSSGVCGFIPMFASVAGSISQGGKRRGAMLGQLDSTHPDIYEVVQLKRTRRDLGSINISVNVQDGFFEDKELVREIAKSMWTSGDPGLLFPSEMSSNSPYPEDIKPLVRYVNPCGEFCSPPFSVCNLVTIGALAAESYSDFEELGYYAAHLGNMVVWITLSNNGEGLPFESPHFKEFYNSVKSLRPVGVGLTGLAEYLLSKGFSYTNLGAIHEIYAALARGTLKASHEWFQATKEEALWDEKYKDKHLAEVSYGRDKCDKFWNTTTLCQAPAGSVSQFLRMVSTGIEPLESFEVNRKFKKPDGSFGSVHLTSRVKKKGVELGKVSIEDQLSVVSVIQSILHTSASKTINVPRETTVEEIEELIYRARSLRLKGLTVFREGCVLESIVTDASTGDGLEDVRAGKTFKWKAPSGHPNLYITTNFDKRSLLKEVFISIGQSGSEVNSLSTGMGRLASLALQAGAKPDLIVKALSNNDSGSSYSNSLGQRAASICEAVARTLLALSNLKGESNSGDEIFDICPTCQHFTLARLGNCKQCKRCNYTTC